VSLSAWESAAVSSRLRLERQRGNRRYDACRKRNVGKVDHGEQAGRSRLNPAQQRVVAPERDALARADGGDTRYASHWTGDGCCNSALAAVATSGDIAFDRSCRKLAVPGQLRGSAGG
jgi:hypothetical protein